MHCLWKLIVFGVGLVLATPTLAVSGLGKKPLETNCENPNALGVSRTVEIDTTGGPGFGFQHYKTYDFLQDKEVILTFDDGPQVKTTRAILDALDKHCTRALFFPVGKMAMGLPHIIRDVAARGHTVGTHTWSHKDLRKKKAKFKLEIEKGASGVRLAVGGPVAPFFRFPFLRDSSQSLSYLSNRNVAVFSTDVDSFDFRKQKVKQLVARTMKRLNDNGKGIILMHDIHKRTAAAMPLLLDELKKGGYKVVHIRPADEFRTLAEYDKLVAKSVKSSQPAAATSRPMSSVIRTVPSQ